MPFASARAHKRKRNCDKILGTDRRCCNELPIFTHPHIHTHAHKHTHTRRHTTARGATDARGGADMPRGSDVRAGDMRGSDVRAGGDARAAAAAVWYSLKDEDEDEYAPDEYPPFA